MAARGQDEAPENELVQQFASVTGVEANVARFYLEMGGGNIQVMGMDMIKDGTFSRGKFSDDSWKNPRCVRTFVF